MRVIAGVLRGRRLVAPRGRTTRPTSDRVREALYSSLGDVSGARVVDLYAGSGALAIEALSRGAASAVVVERAAPAVAAIRQNLTACGLEARCQVLVMSVARAVLLLARRGPFDVALADPPYDELADAAAALGRLVAAGALAPAAQVVLEHAGRDAAPAVEGLTHERTRRYGDGALSFYTVAPAQEPSLD